VSHGTRDGHDVGIRIILPEADVIIHVRVGAILQLDLDLARDTIADLDRIQFRHTHLVDQMPVDCRVGGQLVEFLNCVRDELLEDRCMHTSATASVMASRLPVAAWSN
jgi:hypothetical protein